MSNEKTKELSTIKPVNGNPFLSRHISVSSILSNTSTEFENSPQIRFMEQSKRSLSTNDTKSLTKDKLENSS